MERVRKTLVEQLKEFDSMKKSLLKDLQNRCEKVRFPLFHWLESRAGKFVTKLWPRQLQVIELEISLDETQEQYKTIVKSSGTKTTARKMEFLVRNLDQLGLVQKQVRFSPFWHLLSKSGSSLLCDARVSEPDPNFQLST